jgi:hypothetical protein
VKYVFPIIMNPYDMRVSFHATFARRPSALDPITLTRLFEGILIGKPAKPSLVLD